MDGCFFWYQLTQVDPDKGPQNGRVCVGCRQHVSYGSGSVDVAAGLNQRPGHQRMAVIGTEHQRRKVSLKHTQAQNLPVPQIISTLDFLPSSGLTPWFLARHRFF